MKIGSLAVMCLGLGLALSACDDLDVVEPPELGEEGMGGVELAFPGRTGELATGLVEMDGHAIELTYEVIDGLAILEGDIVLGDADRVAERSAELASGRRSASRTSSASKWPLLHVPYVISSTLSDRTRIAIKEAVNHWKANAVVSFVPRTTEPDYVLFDDGMGCSSSIGRQGGLQRITMGPGCGRGEAIHEMGHAVGLFHENSRSDRDSHVVVRWANVTPGAEFNFKTYAELGLDGTDILDYDFNSVMHLDGQAFSRNGQSTLTRVGGSKVVGQRNGLSDFDRAGVSRRYVYDPNDDHSLRSMLSLKCLDMPGPILSPIQNLQQLTCNGDDNQIVHLFDLPLSDNILVVFSHGFQCMTAGWDFVTGDGTVTQSQCTGLPNQQWTTSLGTGGFRFMNVGLNRCMAVAGSSLDDGAKIFHFPCGGAAEQAFGLYFP
jgi:hypothetical protein